jgi:hypothetical protein
VIERLPPQRATVMCGASDVSKFCAILPSL